MSSTPCTPPVRPSSEMSRFSATGGPRSPVGIAILEKIASLADENQRLEKRVAELEKQNEADAERVASLQKQNQVFEVSSQIRGKLAPPEAAESPTARSIRGLASSRKNSNGRGSSDDGGDGIYSMMSFGKKNSRDGGSPLDRIASTPSTPSGCRRTSTNTPDKFEWLPWLESVCKEMAAENPANPYKFLAEKASSKSRDHDEIKIDTSALDKLSELLDFPGLSRFEALIVAINSVLDEPHDDPLQGSAKADLEGRLEAFNIMPDDSVNKDDFVRFAHEALVARLVKAEKVNPHLMLNFDVNQTIIMVDSISGASEEHVVNEVLASHSWGRIVETPEKTDSIGPFEVVHPEPCLECPKKGLISYEHYTCMAHPYPEDTKNRDEIQNCRQQRRALKRHFTQEGHPGACVRQKFDEMCEALRLPENIKGSQAAAAAGLEGSNVFLLPCFLGMLVELKRRRRSFAIIFRTYGLDLAKVQKELNALCEGRHPMFPDAARLDGSDGDPDYRMHLDSLTQSGTWYRESDAGGEQIALIMGTVAQPAERPKKGDILGLPFYEHLKAAKLKQHRKEGGARVAFQGHDVPGNDPIGIDIRLDNDAVDLFCSLCSTPQTVALRDFYPAWALSGMSSRGGKLLFVDYLKLSSMLPIFFDDNISESDARIIDVRSAKPSLSGYFTSVSFKTAVGCFLVRADPLASITNNKYFLNHIEDCEKKHKELLQRRKQIGELFHDLLARLEDLIPDLDTAMRVATAARCGRAGHRSTVSFAGGIKAPGSGPDDSRALGGQVRRQMSTNCVEKPNRNSLGERSSLLGHKLETLTPLQAAVMHRTSSVTMKRKKMLVETDYCEEPRRHGAVKVIGLQSSIACGCEAVATMLESLGASVIDCNRVKQEIMLRGTRCFQEVVLRFKSEGYDVIGHDTELDHLLDVKASRDPKLRDMLRKIVWPYVAETVGDKVQELDEECEIGLHYSDEPWMVKRVVFIQSPILFESGMHEMLDEVWNVTADAETQVADLIKNKLLTEYEARSLIKQPKPDENYSIPTFTIDNNGSLVDLGCAVVEQWRSLHRRMYHIEADEEPEPDTATKTIGDENQSVLEIVSPEDVLIGAAPIEEVHSRGLWHRMSFVILRHRRTGGFYAIRRSMSKAYMPGRYDLSIFGRAAKAAVCVGDTPNEVAANALQDKLGIIVPPASLTKVTNFEYHGTLPFRNDARVNFFGIVFEAFVDIPVQELRFNAEEVKEVVVLSADACLAMQQHELVPMTAQAYDAYSAFFSTAKVRDHLKPTQVSGILTRCADLEETYDHLEAIQEWKMEADTRGARMYFVGLTGYDLRSQNDVCLILKELGAEVIDSQALLRRCYMHGTAGFNDITETFGFFIVGDDGEVNLRLLGPILHTRPEMLRRFQEIVVPHFLQALLNALNAIEDDILEALDSITGKRHCAPKVIVIADAYDSISDIGLKTILEEVWTVVNNWDELTRKRVTYVPVTCMSDEAAPAGSTFPRVQSYMSRVRRTIEQAPTRNANPPTAEDCFSDGDCPEDEKQRTVLKVEIQIDGDEAFRDDIVKEWCMLQQRIFNRIRRRTLWNRGYGRNSDFNEENEEDEDMDDETLLASKPSAHDEDDAEDQPVLTILGTTGNVVGAAHIGLVRAEGLAHRIAFVILRHGVTRGFYVVRRSMSKTYMPGCLDLALFGRPGSSEWRAGEKPDETAKRTIQEKLGVNITDPRLVGEYQYHGVLPYYDSKVVIFGMLFEATLNLPVESLTLDRDEVMEVNILRAEEVVALSKNELVPMSSNFFQEYWNATMSEGVMFPEGGQCWQQEEALFPHTLK